MARVDYYAIEQAIRDQLAGHPLLAGVTVTIEEELLFGAEQTPWVCVYLDRRDAPADRQRLAAGRQTQFLLRFSIWCWQYSLEGVSRAIQLRDDLVGAVEIALMSDRTLGGTVATSWLEGGELPSARLPDGSGWISGGEVVLIADVAATL
jgi:hypothetical protein